MEKKIGEVKPTSIYDVEKKETLTYYISVVRIRPSESWGASGFMNMDKDVLISATLSTWKNFEIKVIEVELPI